MVFYYGYPMGESLSLNVKQNPPWMLIFTGSLTAFAITRLQLRIFPIAPLSSSSSFTPF